MFQFACFERRFSGQEEFISGQLSFLIVHELAEHMYIYKQVYLWQYEFMHSYFIQWLKIHSYFEMFNHNV